MLIVKENAAVDPLVRTFLLFRGSGVDEPERPPLELIRVCGSKNLRVGDRGRLTDYLILKLSES